MGVMKYFLLLLSLFALCQARDNDACGSTTLRGKNGVPIQSAISVIPAGQQVNVLSVPDGRNVCARTSTPYFVGQKVTACDTYIAPNVRYADPVTYNTVIVTRKGPIDQDAAAYTTYYCDTTP